MTDTRLPEAWLTDPVIDALSSDALRIHFLGLMWSNANGTDGLIPDRALRYLHPDSRRQDCLDELIAARLWQTQSNGHGIVDFLRYQTSAAEMEEKRKINRERQRLFRQRQRNDLRLQLDEQRRKLAGSAPPDVTGDVTHDVGHYVGQEQEQEQANNEEVPLTDHARAREDADPSLDGEAEWGNPLAYAELSADER